MKLIGFGCMRLSTERDRDDTRALAVLHAAFDAGVTLLDTADAYCWDADEAGHNERLIARAIATWRGDRSRIRVATKGGLTRPDGTWVSDGRAGHLRAACEASLRALGVERIALYQLHAVDQRTPLATSVRALASLQRDGLVEDIGLCNVTVGQIEDARRIVTIAAVQVKLSVWNDDNVLSGVVEYCATNSIRLLAYRPLGGVKRVGRTTKDRVLVEIAERHRATPHEIALAALSLFPGDIVPLPGATRVETAQSGARAQTIVLTDREGEELAARFPIVQITAGRHTGRPLQAAAASVPGTSQAAPRTAAVATRDGEIVMVMGLPGAGKTTAAHALAADGYARISRDEDGGSLRGLLPALGRLVESGHTRIVLDNTYVSRKSRAPVVHAAEKLGLPVRCLWLSTSIEDAQVNAVWRMLSKYGRLLGPEAMRQITKQDVNAFGPSVQFRYQRDLEPPHPSEGFSRIDVVPFERARDASFTGRAVIVWFDRIELADAQGDVLRRYAGDGWHVLGLSWRPEVGDDAAAAHEVDEGFARIRERLGVSLDVRYCPHGAGPPVCWCRKPLPGMAVAFIMQYRLDPAQCLYVGAGPQDPLFARRLGFTFRRSL